MGDHGAQDEAQVEAPGPAAWHIYRAWLHAEAKAARGRFEAALGRAQACSGRLDCGRCWSAAVRADGRLRCWGADEESDFGEVVHIAPLRNSPPRQGRLRAVACGEDHTLALLESGEVIWFGSNHAGQAAPLQAPAEAGGGAGGCFRAVAAGRWHSLGLRQDGGDVMCWGRNSERQAPRSGVRGPFRAVAAGGFHSLALAEDGKCVRCFGQNLHGQAPHTRLCDGGGVSKGSEYVAIAAGINFSMALTNVGRVECFGSNSHGQAPELIRGRFVGIAAGGWHALLLRADGSVRCLGWNNHGQAPPEGVPGPFISVAAGPYFSVGLRADGICECWGQNTRGQAPPEGVNIDEPARDR